MLVQILTEDNAFTFVIWIIGGLLGLLTLFVGWQVNKLINNLDSLNTTVTQNNIYQKQHFDMLKEHKEHLSDHETRLVKLEFSNGKAS